MLRSWEASPLTTCSPIGVVRWREWQQLMLCTVWMELPLPCKVKRKRQRRVLVFRHFTVREGLAPVRPCAHRLIYAAGLLVQPPPHAGDYIQLYLLHDNHAMYWLSYRGRMGLRGKRWQPKIWKPLNHHHRRTCYLYHVSCTILDQTAIPEEVWLLISNVAW